MMDTPQIIYGDTPEEIEYAKFELPYKEWKIAPILLPDGRRYEVEFISILRLSQDMQTTIETTGEFYYDEPCLVVLQEVTEDTLQQAVNELYQRGYFDRLMVQPEKTWRLDPTWHEHHDNKRDGKVSILMSDGARAYIEDKSWTPLTVRTPDKKDYPIRAFNLLGLQQYLEREMHFFYADHGMIVMQKVTEEGVSHAVQALYQQGFFDQIVPTK